MESKPAKRRFSSMDNESIESKRIKEISEIEENANEDALKVNIDESWFNEFQNEKRSSVMNAPPKSTSNPVQISQKSADLLKSWYTDELVRFCVVNSNPHQDVVADPEALVVDLLPEVNPLDLYTGSIDSARISSLDYFNVVPLNPETKVKDLEGNRVVIAEFKATGTMGLNNLGNSCYMNSSLQCLVHIPQLVEYFISDQYIQDINTDNPIGYGGVAAQAFASLVKALYTGQGSSFSPSQFKTTMGRFNRSFAGYLQQDSQEFTAFLLDALHEDLNRIKQKPATEKPELPLDKIDDPQAVAELANTCWELHKKRNDSVILDLFVGLYKSTLVCPECDNVSITFDPFGDLTLPFPNLTAWVHTIYYYGSDGKSMQFDVALQTHSSIAQLKAQVREVTGRDCPLEAAEIHGNKIWQWFSDNDTLGDKIGSNDIIAIYESGERPLTVVSKNESHYFGVPLLIDVSEQDSLEDVRLKIKKGYNSDTPFRIYKQTRNSLNESTIYMHRLTCMEPENNTPEAQTEETHEDQQFGSEPEMSSPASRAEPFEIVPTPEPEGPLFGPYDVIVCDFETEMVENEPEHLDNSVATEVKNKLEATDTLTLQDCFDLFSTPEVLGENDLWYCSKCKEFRQATKQLELWKLPEVFTIHLKRFRDIHSSQDKINDVVDFPIEGLDMTKRVLGDNGEEYIYDLIGVDNHFGGLGGGHYTAFAKNPMDNEWFYFNDSNVTTADPDDSVNSAAYLLFYQRRRDPSSQPDFNKVVDSALNNSRQELRDRINSKHQEAIDAAAKASLESPPSSPTRFEGSGTRLGGSTNGTSNSQGLWGNSTSFLDKPQDEEIASSDSGSPEPSHEHNSPEAERADSVSDMST